MLTSLDVWVRAGRNRLSAALNHPQLQPPESAGAGNPKAPGKPLLTTLAPDLYVEVMFFLDPAEMCRFCAASSQAAAVGRDPSRLHSVGRSAASIQGV